jgi:uncharacterized RDD family membrane protein YckC
MSVDGTAPPGRAHPSGYAGIVTRAVALVIDAVVIDVIAVATGGAVQLIASLFGGNLSLDLAGAFAAGLLWFVWAGFYFATFWALTGQTPGNRVLEIRVVSADGGGVKPLQGIRRYLGLVLAALPLGLGFVPVLFNDRRRGLQDWIGGTVVRWVEPEALPPAERLLTPSAATLPAAPPPSDS